MRSQVRRKNKDAPNLGRPNGGATTRGLSLHFSQALILGVFVLVLETRLAFSMGVLAGGTLLRPRYGLVP
ncbi:MAG: hypothetical protein ACLQKY_00005, partial [Terracidiphilus sp.]